MKEKDMEQWGELTNRLHILIKLQKNLITMSIDNANQFTSGIKRR